MTAGSGILHKEYHEQEFARRGGPIQMVQLWVNLPAKYKMTKPRYQGITLDRMGVRELPGGAGRIEVIAGESQGVKGPASTFTPIDLFNVHLKAGSTVTLRLPADRNTGMLVVAGRLVINGAAAPADHFALFENDGEEISLSALEDSIALVLNGEPINEPIAAYGPFVMNTQEEIGQAVDDFNSGKFGRLD
jgi:redox-sensitive bicupin YhaK (pirin superfamily)